VRRLLSRAALLVVGAGAAWTVSVHAQMGDDPCRDACEQQRKSCVEQCAEHRDPMDCEARCDDEAADCMARCSDQELEVRPESAPSYRGPGCGPLPRRATEA